MLWKYIIQELEQQVVLVCDFHGHSKKKNVFMYGCQNEPGPFENYERVCNNFAIMSEPSYDKLDIPRNI